MHSYPHCCRCHKPIILRATDQWFISMETPLHGGTLRSRTLEDIKKVKWDPAWGEERISNMIATRPDWCVSRQRIWGVPIAVFLCEGCGEPLNDANINRKVVELIGHAGADAWFTPEADAALPAGMKCAKCGTNKFTKETDILDVWFESGSSFAAVLGHEPKLPFPADLYLEGGDQHRGWFHSSLLCAMGTRGTPPYRMVVTHGWSLDEQGTAMSQSRGNDVDPVDIGDRLGGEIVRLWVASVDFREDVVGSEQLMQRVAENYRKIRNTFRYIVGNLYDFDPEKDAVPLEQIEELDHYVLLQTSEVVENARKWYDSFQFHKIYQLLTNFCVVTLSAFYFDVLKDRLYISAPHSRPRRAAQTALWQVGDALVRMVAPIMSFTAEEIWNHLPRTAQQLESVHLALFADDDEMLGSGALRKRLHDHGLGDPLEFETRWETLLRVREEVMKKLEEARNNKLIGGGLEAQVSVTAAEPVYSVLTRYREQLRYLFIVSAVNLELGVLTNGSGGVTVQVRKACGKKQERCWNDEIDVGGDARS